MRLIHKCSVWGQVSLRWKEYQDKSQGTVQCEVLMGFQLDKSAIAPSNKILLYNEPNAAARGLRGNQLHLSDAQNSGRMLCGWCSFQITQMRAPSKLCLWFWRRLPSLAGSQPWGVFGDMLFSFSLFFFIEMWKYSCGSSGWVRMKKKMVWDINCTLF